MQAVFRTDRWSVRPQTAIGIVCALVLALITLHDLAVAIEPWAANPWYWSHRGQPVMLLGGSDDDNLFQWPAEKLGPQLDRIAAAGGNVVRNTMSDRKDAGFEVYPFLQLESGQYDLNQWNPEYWQRFERFLSETAKRSIFVQIEVWDRFDYSDSTSSDPTRWENHPYNPSNNINYTVAETTLQRRYPAHPGQNQQPFFFSTPQQRNLVPLLKFQQAFVNKVLDHTLQYDHILYCIDNETSGEEAWATYWAKFLHQRASAVGQKIYVTEMWDDWDLTADRHRRTLDHPELYAFVDVSQNNHNRGRKHWDNLQFVRQWLSEQPRPINTTKTYGADGNKFGHTDQDGVERFWRHLLGGVASARFHRPDSGLGINDKAVHCIRAARQIEVAAPLYLLTPAMEIVTNCDDNEAYAAATANRSTLVIYFPAGKQERSVGLAGAFDGSTWQALWVDIDRGVSLASTQVGAGEKIVPPQAGNLVVALRRTDQPLLDGELLKVHDRAAFIMMPAIEKRRTPQPWVMYAPTLLPNYPDEHERWLHEQLLAAGIAIAGIDVGESYGSPLGVEAMDALYDVLTRQRGFAAQPGLLGRSRGGLWVTSWASQNVDKVAAIAGIYPVFDLTTYPGIQRAASAYGLSDSELSTAIDTHNPIRKAQRIAEHGIPMFLIHGVPDQVVPFNANSIAMQSLYQIADKGDAIQVIAIADQGHNFWPGFFRNQPMVDFLIQHILPK